MTDQVRNEAHTEIFSLIGIILSNVGDSSPAMCYIIIGKRCGVLFGHSQALPCVVWSWSSLAICGFLLV